MKKTILITGASTGIGKATAKYFNEKDWNVVATMRSPEKEEELNKLEDVLVTKLDVTDKASIQSAVKEGIDKFGQIDVLLNNAGYGAFGILEAATDESIKRQFDVNVIGLINAMREVIPHFRANKSGLIINVSSIGGKMTFPMGTLYHGTKFAVEGMTEALSFEMAEIGVKMKIIEPGAIKTDFATRSLDFYNDESISEYQGLVGKMMGLMDSVSNQGAEPVVVAEAVYEAATDGSDKLRYTAGEDAKEYMKNRKEMDDEAFMTAIKSQFGL